MSRFFRKAGQTAAVDIDTATGLDAAPASADSNAQVDCKESSDSPTTAVPASNGATDSARTEKTADVSTTVEAERDAHAADEDDSKYPSGWKLAPLTFGLCLATFVVALDNTVRFATPLL